MEPTDPDTPDGAAAPEAPRVQRQRSIDRNAPPSHRVARRRQVEVVAEPEDLTQVPAERTDQFVNPAGSGRMWSEKVPGSLTFRGNPTRTYYGRGDVPKAPKVRWFHPQNGGMRSSSSVGGESKTWCGSGWTGQPAVFERDGRTWVVFGAYDWDGAGLVLDDFLFEGGENSQFHAVELNRSYDAGGKATVAPELVFNTPSWDHR